jgi:hypothetical protein
MLLLFLLFAASCARQMTKEEWESQYKPKNANEAGAMAIWYAAKTESDAKLREAEARIETITMMNKFKMFCVVGIVCSVIAIAVGLALNIKLAATLGMVGLLGCGAGYGLAYAEIVYGKYIAIVGSIFSIVVLSAIIFVICRTLIQVVKGGEWFKNEAAIVAPEAVALFQKAQKTAQNGTEAVVSTTEKIVDKIRSKI